MFMKRILVILILLSLFACNQINNNEIENKEEEIIMNNNDILFMVDDEIIEVEWLDNESVEALKELIKDDPIIIDMSMYGDFEQVGPLGKTLPRNDMQITTSPGDIVLYSGNQLVVFYASNSWSYTKLGRILLNQEELEELLSNGNISIKLSLNN